MSSDRLRLHLAPSVCRRLGGKKLLGTLRVMAIVRKVLPLLHALNSMEGKPDKMQIIGMILAVLGIVINNLP